MQTLAGNSMMPPIPAQAQNLSLIPASHHVGLIFKGAIMGKYLLAWILGVPAFLLVLIYLFIH